MTVPAGGGGGVLGARKPLYRCIPEIHVTRLSASSSLRPKLGLLLLFVVLLVTICLAGVPLVTKVLVPLVHSRSRPQPALILGLDQALLEASSTSERSFVTSAALTQASLRALAKWSLGETRQDLIKFTNSSQIQGAQRTVPGIEFDHLFLVPGQQAKADIVSKDNNLELLDFRVREADQQVADWWREHGLLDEEQLWNGKLDNSQLVGLAYEKVTLNLGVPVTGTSHGIVDRKGEMPMLMVQGDFLREVTEEGTTVVIEGASEGLDLCLVLHNKKTSLAARLPNTNQCSSFGLRKSRLAIILPCFEVSSRVALKESLSKTGMKSVFSETADFSLISHQRGLTLGELFQVVSFNLKPAEEKLEVTQKGVEEVIFDRPFALLVKQRTTNLTIISGQVWDHKAK